MQVSQSNRSLRSRVCKVLISEVLPVLLRIAGHGQADLLLETDGVQQFGHALLHVGGSQVCNRRQFIVCFLSLNIKRHLCSILILISQIFPLITGLSQHRFITLVVCRLILSQVLPSLSQ